VAAIGKMADAAVVGSSFITAIERAPADGRAAAVRDFVREMTGRKV
jgi:tryptophan synthase alpha subunit